MSAPGLLAGESNKQPKWGLDTSQETISDLFFFAGGADVVRSANTQP